MIRQAISCDICGAEKKQTNHWFVACEQAGELRLRGWGSHIRQRPGTKHLCGQTCLHKLVDEYIAQTIGARLSSAPAGPGTGAHFQTDASLTSAAAFSKSSPAPKAPRPQPIAEMPLARAVPEIAASAVVQFPRGRSPTQSPYRPVRSPTRHSSPHAAGEPRRGNASATANCAPPIATST